MPQRLKKILSADKNTKPRGLIFKFKIISMIKVGFSIFIIRDIFYYSILCLIQLRGTWILQLGHLNDPLEDGQFPIIVGNVKDQAGNPVSNAQVKVAFATDTVSSTTNNVGSFYIELKTPVTTWGLHGKCDNY